MIVTEHVWVETDPPRVGATVCRKCGVVFDTQQGGFVDPETGDVSMRMPPCPLVPESQHTPGPWEVSYLDKAGQRVVQNQHIEICTCWHHSVGAIEQEMEANARLIARAPAMRDALEAVLLFYDAPGWDAEKRARWRALTGSRKATTRVLADTVRRALR